MQEAKKTKKRNVQKENTIQEENKAEKPIKFES